MHYRDISRFCEVFNSTQFSQIYLMTRIDIVKQYFYNSSIINYNMNKDIMIFNFFQCFINITDQLEETIKETSTTKSFLKYYKFLFKQYMYNNFTDLFTKINNINDEGLNVMIIQKVNYGFKSICSEIFELLQVLMNNYFKENEYNKSLVNTTSELNKSRFWDILNDLAINLVRPWYKYMNKSINDSYYSMALQRVIQYIFLFVFMLVLISIYYWVIMKRYENKFIKTINKSFDLINLMPEEIKKVIVNKLNE